MEHSYPHLPGPVFKKHKRKNLIQIISSKSNKVLQEVQFTFFNNCQGVFHISMEEYWFFMKSSCPHHTVWKTVFSISSHKNI